VVDLRAGLPVTKLHVYHPRDIILAQLAGVTSVGRGSDGTSQPEQLSEIIAYGCDEVWGCLSPGVDQTVTALSLYARYRLAELLDNKDWKPLGKALGLELLDTDDAGPASVYSITDGILADWVQDAGAAATVRALHTAVESIQSAELTDTLLSLTPLYRYMNKDNNNDIHNELILQGHQGHQRPVSSSSNK